MTLKKTMILSLLIGAVSLQAQSGEKYRTRLSPVPALIVTGQRATNVQPATVAGVGSSAATLAGRKLTVTGTFEKMASQATEAHLFLSPITGARGDQPPVFDLTVSKTGDGTSGTIAGAFDLTPQQVDALKKGRFYVQIHSVGTPTGHLFGWLLKQ